MSDSLSVAGSYYKSQATQQSPFVLNPLDGTAFISHPKDQAWFLTFSYQRRAGTPQGVLGGMPGSAAGAIEGLVYLDANADGRYTAGERGAAGLTVTLDDRFSVRTDEQGRFSFPFVATGPHSVTVLSDNLPLPWSLSSSAAHRMVNVHTRDTASLEFAARTSP